MLYISVLKRSSMYAWFLWVQTVAHTQGDWYMSTRFTIQVILNGGVSQLQECWKLKKLLLNDSVIRITAGVLVQSILQLEHASDPKFKPWTYIRVYFDTRYLTIFISCIVSTWNTRNSVSKAKLRKHAFWTHRGFVSNVAFGGIRSTVVFLLPSSNYYY